jgi:TolB-like protein/DNA-binding SARP family transcriptional activator
MPEFRLTLLGAFALSAGAPCVVPSRKAQALLALLALPPGRTHRRDRLATMLWSGHTDESARQNLRQCLTTLRRGIQNDKAMPVIIEGALLRLDAGRVVVDVVEFEEAIRSRDPVALGRALTLYKGDLLEGLSFDETPFEEWLIGERRRLNALAIEGLSQLLRHQQQQGERAAAMQTALRLLTIDPLQEGVHRSLMRLYNEIGNAAQALRQYVACEKVLRRELGVEPEDATKELRRVILRSRNVAAPKADDKTEPARDDRFSRPNGIETPSEADVSVTTPSDRPSIAVLPFSNLSGDSAQDYFSDGITEDVITGLSRFSELFVIARNSSFVYKGKAADARQIGRELGVRYLLEGSVRKLENRVRITGQLVDTTTGTHIWADRFDGAMEDIFDLQEKMSTIILGALAPKLELAEIDRATRKPTESLDAYDYYIRGMASFHQGTGKSFAEALELFEKAIELDPSFASAYAMAAWCHYIPVPFWTLPEKVREAERLARLAARLGPNNAAALSVAGFVVASVAGDFDMGLALVDRAMVLNPNLVNAWYLSGWVRVLSGEPEVALEHFSRAERLSPFDPFKWGCHLGVAYAHFMVGRDDQALSSVEHCLRDMPNFRPALLIVAASSAFLGATDRAAMTVARIRELDPTKCISQLKARAPFRQPEQIVRLLDGLRRAGLPE